MFILCIPAFQMLLQLYARYFTGVLMYGDSFLIALKNTLYQMLEMIRL